MGDARQELAQRREPLAAPQVGLQAVALGRLAADGACQTRRERKRQRDASQGQPRGQPVTLERSVDEERIDQAGHHPGGSHDAPVDRPPARCESPR